MVRIFTSFKRRIVNLERIVVGFDFSFGKNRSYKAKDIEALSGIKTTIIDEFKLDGVGVHASLIKEYLTQGDIKRQILFWGEIMQSKASS